MLNIVIELWPGGDERRKRVIGEVSIANDCTGGIGLDNYDVTLAPSGRFAERHGRVENHLRCLSPYHLVAKAINAALGERAV
jgi:hypothetical protein